MSEAVSAEDVAALMKRLARLEAVLEIQNVMGRRAYLHSAGKWDEELAECWAHETEGAAFEPENWGVIEGMEVISQHYKSPPPVPGMLTEHTLTTPVIEVADDLKTAKSVWISPGHETFRFPPGTVVDPVLPVPMWCWCRYAVDWVKESTGWKIWHLHIYTTFRTPFDQDWVQNAVNPPKYYPQNHKPFDIRPEADLAKLPSSTRPITFNQPYHPDKVAELQPFLPYPYETWADVKSYTDPLDESESDRY